MHGEALRQHVDGDTQHVLTLARNWRQVPLSEAEQAMLAYVEIVALNPGMATADHVATLRRVGFSDAEIFEIVMVTAYYALRCRMADALGVEVDARSQQDTALVQAFTFRPDILHEASSEGPAHRREPIPDTEADAPAADL